MSERSGLTMNVVFREPLSLAGVVAEMNEPRQ